MSADILIIRYILWLQILWISFTESLREVKKVSQAPFRSVVEIVSVYEAYNPHTPLTITTEYSTCTGTLISPQHVLTAANCFFPAEEDELFEPNLHRYKLFVAVNSNHPWRCAWRVPMDVTPGHRIPLGKHFNAKSVRMPAEWITNRLPIYDIAVVELDRHTPTPYMRFEKSGDLQFIKNDRLVSMVAGDEYVTAGYAFHIASPRTQCRMWTGTFKASGSKSIFGVEGRLPATSEGQAGSGIFKKIESDYVLYGVISEVYPNPLAMKIDRMRFMWICAALGEYQSLVCGTATRPYVHINPKPKV
eukprot:223459_1